MFSLFVNLYSYEQNDYVNIYVSQKEDIQKTYEDCLTFKKKFLVDHPVFADEKKYFVFINHETRRSYYVAGLADDTFTHINKIKTLLNSEDFLLTVSLEEVIDHCLPLVEMNFPDVDQVEAFIIQNLRLHFGICILPKSMENFKTLQLS